MMRHRLANPVGGLVGPWELFLRACICWMLGGDLRYKDQMFILAQASRIKLDKVLWDSWMLGVQHSDLSIYCHQSYVEVTIGLLAPVSVMVVIQVAMCEAVKLFQPCAAQAFSHSRGSLEPTVNLITKVTIWLVVESLGVGPEP